MSGTKHVRIVGSDDVWEVLCETESTMVLVNPTARLRREIASLQVQLDFARAQLADRMVTTEELQTR